MDKSSLIYVAGHNGLLGSVIVKRLKELGFTNLLTRTKEELDLTNQLDVRNFFEKERPQYVIDSAAKVGSIQANATYPAEYLYENLEIQNNLMWSAKDFEVKKFLFIGTSLIYPRDAQQPMKEEFFSQGAPESANEGYAYAKITGMKLCEFINKEYGLDFTSCMPTNIYGEGANFDSETAHVIPSLIRRFHDAKTQNLREVTVWGTGNSRREFIYVDDLADAIVWLLQNYNDKQFLNIGTGEDISIKELAMKIKALVGYKGRIIFDTTKPEGSPRRLLDVARLHATGWHHKTSFDEGLKRTYSWYLTNIAKEGK